MRLFCACPLVIAFGKKIIPLPKIQKRKAKLFFCMKKITKIGTVRNLISWPSFHLVYEWEDVLKEELHLKMRYRSKYLKDINEIIARLSRNLSFFYIPSCFYSKNKCMLTWDLAAEIWDRYDNRSNVIPCVIDFFLQRSAIRNFSAAYSRNPFVLISSAEAYQFLLGKTPNLIFHYPLSISDKYRIDSTTKFSKEYDIVLFGRQNPVLNEYLATYMKSHPDCICVSEDENKKFHYYSSTGDYIGDINTREQYINLMRKSRIGLYSTPGIDGGEARTNGFNQVTPKFLELLACGCHVIARYKENPDTDFYRLSDFSPNISSYEEFEKRMDYCRSCEVDVEVYSTYLEQHYTSKRVLLLNDIMNQYNQMRK